MIILDCVDSQAGDLIGLGSVGKTNAADRPGVGALHAGNGALDMIALILSCAVMAIAAPARGFHHGKLRGVSPTVHCAVRQVCVQCKPLTTVTQYATEGLHWMRGADLRQVGMAGQAVFNLTGQGG